MENKSRMYEKYKARYERGGCTREQLFRLAELGALTEAEVYEILGETAGE